MSVAPTLAGPPANAAALPPSSLIICTRNRARMLNETVASILVGTHVPTELIIVDQSSQPNRAVAALSTTRDCQIRYLWSQTVGLSRANNLGVAAARYDLIAFTHDDVLVTPDWYAALLGALVAAGPRSVVTGRILASLAEQPGGFAPTLKVDTTPAQYRGRLKVDVLKPLNMAMDRAALSEVGGFDERLGPGTIFPGAEDSDLGFRLLEAGYLIAYVPSALIYHRAWRANHEYLPLRWGYGVAQGAFFAKHLQRGELFMLRRIARDVRRRARRFPRRLWYERERAFGDPLYLLGNLVGAARWTWQQRRSKG